MPIDWLKRLATLKNLTFALSVVMFVWVIWYCYTGLGGAQELVSRLLPIALVLQILFMCRRSSCTHGCPPQSITRWWRSTSASASMPSSTSCSSTKTSRSTGRVRTPSRISSSAC